MKKLTGKVALVTGASKGIGAAIAKSFAAEGASVVVNFASSREGADKVVSDIIADGGKAVSIPGDISKAEDIDRLIEESLLRFGRLDILVNNAGIYQFGSLEEITEDEFHRHFNLNVLGLLLMIQKTVKHFGENGGSVINISSTVTRVTPPGSAVYTASKGAVEAITSVLAKELGHRKIRVNAISPGLIETEGAHAAGVIGSDFHHNAVSRTPLGRIGYPADIASIATFLASEESGWLTGEVLMADGGMR